MSFITENNKISIIVPVYNSQDTLIKCINSIINQDYKKWELILINDGSSDNSGKICDYYAHEFSSKIWTYHIRNSGPGAARNKGIILCKTDWLTFVDADDELEANYLSNFNSDVHENADNIIILQGYKRVSETYEELGEEIFYYDSTYYGTNFLEKAFSSQKIFEFGQSIGKLYSTRTIKKNSIYFPENFRLSEDHHFFIQYLSHTKKLITRSGKFYNYIYHNTDCSLSQKKHPHYEIYQRYLALLDACERLKSNHSLSKEINERLIDYFAVTSSISLLLSTLYTTNVNKKERIELLTVLHKDNYIKFNFCPKNIKGKIIKNIIFKLPISLQDFIFKLSIK